MCEVGERTVVGGKELGYTHLDVVLADEKAAHKLFSLVGDTQFYV